MALGARQNSCKQFQHQKEQCLSGVDLSRKGSVDAAVLDLVKLINDQTDCFTTSSCSGRVIVVDNTNEHGDVQKYGCHWLYVTHEDACSDSIKTSLQDVNGAAVFKFEPMVMHTQVRTLELAQRLHATAVASGFRNSGISISGKGKIVVAIRSTHCLEVPLSSNGQILVSDMYIEHLVQCANKKMEENMSRIARFYSNFKSLVENLQEKPTPDKHSKNKHHPSTPSELCKVHTAMSNEEDHHVSLPDETSDSSQTVQLDGPKDLTVNQDLKDSSGIEECFDALLFDETE